MYANKVSFKMKFTNPFMLILLGILTLIWFSQGFNFNGFILLSCIILIWCLIVASLVSMVSINDMLITFSKPYLPFIAPKSFSIKDINSIVIYKYGDKGYRKGTPYFILKVGDNSKQRINVPNLNDPGFDGFFDALKLAIGNDKVSIVENYD